MRNHLILLAILLVALLVLRMYSQSIEFFEDGSGGSDVTVVIAKADWCGHCKKAAPEFNKLMNASPITLQNGTKATVKMLDADADKDEIMNLPQKVRGYPTIMVMKGSDVKEYPGERTYDGVVEFLNMM